MKGLVTVFGGSGFVGAQIVRALAKRGLRVRVAVRNPGRAYRLPMLGDVGQIEIMQANVRMPASIDRALDGAEGCVNCVGVLHEFGRQKFMSLHVMGAHNIASAAQAHGVSYFVQVSALGADPNSSSKYARTKAQGEVAVREALPRAVVVRPSVVFGQDDRFFNRFAEMALMSPALPLIGGGHTLFQPVFVGDVADAVAAALRLPAAAGKTFELGGPAVYSFKELMQILLAQIGRERFLAPLPFGLARLLGQACDLVTPFLPIAPPLTADQVDMLRTDNVVTPRSHGLSELGIHARALEPIIPTYLYRYRKGGQYAEMNAQAAA